MQTSIQQPLQTWISVISTKTWKINSKISKRSKQLTAQVIELIEILETSLNWKNLELTQKTKQMLIQSLLLQETSEIRLNDALIQIQREDESNKYDEMTGLLNKKMYTQILDHLLGRQTWFTLVNFDLNEFKKINDTFGHNIWDDVLKEFAKTLWIIFNDEKSAAFRTGWDEFHVVSCKTKEEIMLLINKLQHWLNNRSFKFLHEWQLQELYIKFAFWCEYFWPQEQKCTCIKEILQIVDQKMYDHKNNSKIH